MNRKQKKNLKRIAVTAVLLAALSFLPDGLRLRPFLYLVPYFLIGYDILRKAFKGIINRQPTDENFLMAVATVGAIALGEYTEGVAVMLFYQIGELFQSYAVGKSRKNIAALMDIRPDHANIPDGAGGIVSVDPDTVAAGSIIIVRPGERIPIDGILVEGSGSIDTKALTGESVPRHVRPGDEAISGCISLDSVLTIRTERPFGESAVSRILELVENAASLKSKSENFISRFARIYTPAVCLSAVAVAFLPPIAGWIAGKGPGFGTWIYRALTFLVISCPCALVVSIPLTFFAGLGGASSAGILIKGSSFLEALSRTAVVIFDKTGTLTEGVFEVTGIRPERMSSEELLEIAAAAESSSTHPAAVSIVKASGKKPDRMCQGETVEFAGEGLKADIEGREILCGNKRLMERFGVRVPEKAAGGTLVYVAADGKYEGCIEIGDRVKPTSAEAVRRLGKDGIRKTVMLTGDAEEPAERVAEELGIDKVYSRLLPQDKVTCAEKELMDKKPGEILVFAGDGINDAPVLARCDIGIAMGALGSDAAIEAADVVLMDDDPLRISAAVRISRKCMRIVRENVIFALTVKFLCLVMGALGFAGMWAAVFADVGVMVIAVLNAIRALDVKGI